MKIRILKGAKNDLEEGFDFYEMQEPGIGAYFLTSLSSDIDSLKLYAGIHPQTVTGYYRMLAHRFPFVIYYKIVEDEIRIYAVLDTRRSPTLHYRRLFSS